MKFALFTFVAAVALAADWKTAEPGWQYGFPRDHHAHADFKTEWWYFTGNLSDTTGRRFGFEITFFREGVRPPAQRTAALSRFVVNDLKFAHFAITDARGGRFLFRQKTSRGSFGEAGFDDANRIAWIDDWSLLLNDDGSFDLHAVSNEGAAQLHLRPMKPPVVHGEDGISLKASSAGHASCYYSITRLAAAGELRIGATSFSVHGSSWFDHEWATNQLAPDQIGWNWLCVQFSDNTELMLYQMRLANGQADPSSSGTYVDADGSAVRLKSNAFSMTPQRFWKSSASGAAYPIEWRVIVPERQLDLVVRAVVDNQELNLPPLTYWEGAVDVTGTKSGVGYLELTGYAAPLKALQR